jgi:hypothetical protein
MSLSNLISNVKLFFFIDSDNISDLIKDVSIESFHPKLMKKTIDEIDTFTLTFIKDYVTITRDKDIDVFLRSNLQTLYLEITIFTNMLKEIIRLRKRSLIDRILRRLWCRAGKAR